MLIKVFKDLKTMMHILKTIGVCLLGGLSLALLTLMVLHPFKSSSIRPACVENLKLIQDAKIRWMQINDKTYQDTPTWNDLKPLLAAYAKRPGWKDGLPVCPNGGTYTLGEVVELPKCSVGGPEHSIEPLSFPPPYHP